MSEHMLKQLEQMTEPKLVIFDLDGTLVDSIPDLAASVDHMLEAAGYMAAGQERIRQWVGNGAPTLVKRAVAWATNMAEDDLSATMVEMNLERFMVHYRDHCGDATSLFPGVVEGLQELQARGCKLAMVTNKPAQFVPSIFKSTGLTGFFEQWLGGDSLDNRKPHPEPLLHMMKVFGVEPKDTLMVGDSSTDIQAARAAGVAVAAVVYGYNHGQPVANENPDYLLNSLVELCALQSEVA